MNQNTSDNLRLAYLIFLVLSEMAALITAFFFIKTGIVHVMLLTFGLYPGCRFWAKDFCKGWSQQKKDNAVLIVMLFFPALFFKGAEVTLQQFYLGVGIADLVGYFMLKLWSKYPFPKDADD